MKKAVTSMEQNQEQNPLLKHNTEILFSSQDFRVIRFLLRFLSLWRPRSAGFLESYVYPVFVNLLLLIIGTIRDSILTTRESDWLGIFPLYFVHDTVIWLCHILGNRYFASNDLETNVLKFLEPLTGITKLLNRRLKILNAAVIISMTFFSIMLCTLCIVSTMRWVKGDDRFSAHWLPIHGPVNHVLYGFLLVAIIYNLGVGLALFWTLALLYCCYEARLQILEKIFLKWEGTSADAVSCFLQLYARPVKHSWKYISWWFLAHSIVALAIPLYGYSLAQAVSGVAYNSKLFPQFICYMIFIVTIWLAPTVIGELIKRREREFMEHINDISPWLLEVESGRDGQGHSISVSSYGTHSYDKRGGDSLPMTVSNNNYSPHNHGQISTQNSIRSTSAEGSDSPPKYTFVSRGSELTNFLEFLKRRTPRLVSQGYSIQLNLSLISLISGAIVFLIQLHSMDSKDMTYINSNSTMSYT